MQFFLFFYYFTYYFSLCYILNHNRAGRSTIKKRDFSISLILNLVQVKGLEPPRINPIDPKSIASANSAIPAQIKKWWTSKDSNLRPSGYEPDALTNWARGPWYNYNITLLNLFQVLLLIFCTFSSGLE